MSTRTTIVLAVVLVLLLALGVLVPEAGSPPGEVPATFIEFVKSEVRGLRIRHGAGEVELTRDAADPERWRVAVGASPVPANADAVEDILLSLGRVKPRVRWPAAEIKPGETAKWGLEPGIVTVVLEFADRKTTLTFGNRTPEGGNCYARKDGDDAAWVVAADVLQDLDGKRPDALREKRPLHVSAWDMASVEAVLRGGRRIVLEKQGTTDWRLREPVQGPADPVKVDEFLARITGMQVTKFVEDGNVDLDRHGLLDPEVTLTVKMQGTGKSRTLRFAAAKEEGEDPRFALDGEPGVLACSPVVFEGLRALDAEALRDRNLLRLGYARLDGIAYTRGVDGWKLSRVLERWDVEKPERCAADAASVDALVELLRKAVVAKFLDGEDPAALGLDKAETAAASLVLTGVDESGNRTLLLGKAREEGMVEARLLGQGGVPAGPVVLLAADLPGRLDEGWLSFKDRAVLAAELFEVKAVVQAAGGRTDTFLRKSDAWVAAPGGAAPDAERLSKAVALLLGVRCTAFEAKASTGFEKWGLGEPPAAAALTLVLQKPGEKEERRRTLLLGNAVPGGGVRYARIAGEEFVFLLPEYQVSGAEIVPFFETLATPWAAGVATPPPAPPAPPEPPPPGEE